jgi:hypothetical protein
VQFHSGEAGGGAGAASDSKRALLEEIMKAELDAARTGEDEEEARNFSGYGLLIFMSIAVGCPG